MSNEPQPPARSKEFMRFEEVEAIINVIIDDRFCASFPMESYSQVVALVDWSNLAFCQRLRESKYD